MFLSTPTRFNYVLNSICNYLSGFTHITVLYSNFSFPFHLVFILEGENKLLTNYIIAS